MVFGWKKMDNILIDASQRGKGRETLSAPFSLDNNAQKSLDMMTDGFDRLTLVLQSVSIESLKSALANQIERLNIEGALRVSAELTARSIAPCFRYLQSQVHPLNNGGSIVLNTSQRRELETEGAIVIRDDELTISESVALSSGADYIMLCADLQWIVAKYPDHLTEWQRAQAIFSPMRFRKVAEYLYWGGQRTSGQIAKAMALTKYQQRECAWIQCLNVKRWKVRLFERLTIAKERIALAIRDKDKRSIKEQDATIENRSNLWLCAELAEWKPQLTANLYLMLTGQKLSRQAVANQLSKLPKVRRVDEVIAY